MIVVDSSALVAIFEDEPDAPEIATRLAAAERRFISAVNAHETALVLHRRRGPEAVRRLWQFLLEEQGFEVMPFDLPASRRAVEAFQRYGKGGGHPAQLNLADCAAYALSQQLRLPLLFKGEDFSRTDVMVAE